MALERIRIKDLTEQTGGIPENARIPFDDGDVVEHGLLPDLRHAVNYSVKDKRYGGGAAGDGTTDDTAKFEAAVADVPEGLPIYVPEGTYILNSLEIDRDVSWQLHPKAILKHKANPGGPMFLYTVACTGTIRGGTFDGNKENQSPYPQARYALLSIFSDGATVENVRFQNYLLSAIEDGQTLTSLKISRCDFLDGAEHGGTYAADNPQYSCCVNIFRADEATSDTTPLYIIDDCYMGQSENNLAQGAAPGGIIAAGSNAFNVYVRLLITNNTFERLGQSCPTSGNAHHIGAVDLYSACKNSVISGNLFLNNRYQPVKLTNCSRTIVTDNIIIGCEAASTAGLGLIDWQASLRTGEEEQGHETLIIRGNIIEDGGSGVCGIRVSCGNSETSKKIIVSENEIKGCGKAMSFTNVSDVILIKDNLCYAEGGGGSAGALEFANFTGVARIEGNYFEAVSGVHALYVVSGNTGEFYFDDNHFKASASGISSCVISGFGAFHPAKIHCTRNKFEGTSSGTSIAANGIIEELWFDVNNSVTGTHIITFANITNCVGSIFYSGTPEAVVPASRQTLFRRTDVPADYQKVLDNSGTNTGWRIIECNNSSFVNSGDYTATINDGFIIVDATAASRTITLPAAAECHGRPITVVKYDSSVNTVTVQTVQGGNVTLSTQYAAKRLVSTGGAWIPSNFV